MAWDIGFSAAPVARCFSRDGPPVPTRYARYTVSAGSAENCPEDIEIHRFHHVVIAAGILGRNPVLLLDMAREGDDQRLRLAGDVTVAKTPRDRISIDVGQSQIEKHHFWAEFWRCGKPCLPVRSYSNFVTFHAEFKPERI